MRAPPRKGISSNTALPGQRSCFNRVTVCSAALFCCVFLQKFALPLGGDLQGPLLIPILGAMLLYLLASRQAFIDTHTAIPFGLLATAVVMANFLGEAPFSLPSILLMLTLCAMFCFKITIAEAEYHKILYAFEFYMVGVIFIEVGQYLIQLSGHNMPGLNGRLPDWLLLQFYNYTQPIYFGSVYMKSNGVFFPETSYLSQFLGVALAVEAAVFKRTWMILLFLAGVMVSLGGTGMILAAIVMSEIALRQPRLMLQLSIILVVAVIVGFFYGMFDLLATRMSEFSDPNASASVRFFLPYIKMHENLTGSLSRFLFGAGAGFLDRTHGFAWSSPSKVWVEEGFISFLFYVPFIGVVFFRHMYAPLLSLILFADYFFVTGSGLMQPAAVGSSVFLATGYIVLRTKT